MRKLVVSEFVTLDGVMQAPGGKDEDRDGGFEHAMIKDCDALLLGRGTYVTHAEAFEPMAPGDPFGDAMNTPRKYVVSKTLEKPIWRWCTPCSRTTLVDELHLLVYPLTLGSGKRVLPDGVHATFGLLSATSYPTGVVGLHYARQLE